MNLVPRKKFFINIELALILGLCEEWMITIIIKLPYTRYQKAGILMLGTAGVFALLTEVVRPLVEGTLKTVSKADQGSQISRLVIHIGILALMFFVYLGVFF